MAKSNQPGKKKEPQQDDQQRHAPTIAKLQVTPDGNSDVSYYNADESGDDPNEIRKEKLFLEAGLKAGQTIGAAEAVAALEKQSDSSSSYDSGSSLDHDNGSVDSLMSGDSSPFIDTLSSSDEAEGLADLRKQSPTYKTMEDERHHICKYKMHH